MSITIEHGLSKKELKTILKVLSVYKPKIEKVGIFGSRANKQYKEYSDIDLVLYGDLNEQETDHLNTLFDESNLGLRVDIKTYKNIDYPPLKRHIDSLGKTLFTKEQLNQKKPW